MKFLGYAQPSSRGRIEYTFSHHLNAIVKKFLHYVIRSRANVFGNGRGDYDLAVADVGRFRERLPRTGSTGAKVVERLKIRLVFKGYSLLPPAGPA